MLFYWGSDLTLECQNQPFLQPISSGPHPSQGCLNNTRARHMLTHLRKGTCGDIYHSRSLTHLLTADVVNVLQLVPNPSVHSTTFNQKMNKENFFFPLTDKEGHRTNGFLLTYRFVHRFTHLYPFKFSWLFPCCSRVLIIIFFPPPNTFCWKISLWYLTYKIYCLCQYTAGHASSSWTFSLSLKSIQWHQQLQHHI